jgi:hypothetical protein
MIFSLLIIHNHDRTSSITRVLHTTTWDYFTSRLPDRFSHSPKVVKEAIMTDINDLVQESVKPQEMLGHLSLQCIVCLKFWKCVLTLFPFLRLPSTWLIIFLQMSANPNSWNYSQSDRIRAKFKILFDGYRKMLDQSFSKSKDLGDMVRYLPGVVVQKHMGMQGMADLYRIEPDLLERLIKSTIEPLRSSHTPFPYMLGYYLSGFLLDQERSQLYYCDPMLQHISICRQFLSLLDGSNAFDFQS